MASSMLGNKTTRDVYDRFQLILQQSPDLKITESSWNYKKTQKDVKRRKSTDDL